MRERLEPGIRRCEKCKKEVLEWTITEVLKDGVFYSVCRTCKAEMEGEKK